jgi:hypothetical protein
VKRSGRDEPVQVVIHMCMEAMLGISLYSYPYLKLAKMLSFLLSLMSSLQQNWRRGQNRGSLGGEGKGHGEQGAKGRYGPTKYTQMNK